MGKKVYTGDPFVMFDPISQCYYCYATSGVINNKTFYIYKSKDMVNWDFVDFAMDLEDGMCWGKDWFWAPECYYNPNNKHYYMFYSARVKDELRMKYFSDNNYVESAKIGVAVSNSPCGPFVNIERNPIDYYPFDDEYIDINQVSENVFELNNDNLLNSAPKGRYISSIDASLFFEEGRIYLYFSRCCYLNCLYDEEYKKFVEESNVLGVELDTEWWFDKDAKTMPKINEKFISYNEKGLRKDGFKNVVTYHGEPQKWENAHIFDYENSNGQNPNRRWAEGSTTFIRRINGKKTYCITYSCNYYQNEMYGVGIAFASSPLGPYKKYDSNPIISQDEEMPIYSTGHGSLVENDKGCYYFFHARDSKESFRSMYFAKLDVKENGVVEVSEITKCTLNEESIEPIVILT